MHRYLWIYLPRDINSLPQFVLSHLAEPGSRRNWGTCTIM